MKNKLKYSYLLYRETKHGLAMRYVLFFSMIVIVLLSSCSLIEDFFKSDFEKQYGNIMLSEEELDITLRLEKLERDYIRTSIELEQLQTKMIQKEIKRFQKMNQQMKNANRIKQKVIQVNMIESYKKIMLLNSYNNGEALNYSWTT